jgi:hypothetical protein
MELTRPTTIEAAMPRLVVRRQKRSMTRAGRLALAATLKAQPTRKVTLSFSNWMPSTMAMALTTTAATLAERTLLRSVSLSPMTLSIRSCATAPLAARISPLTVPSTVVKAMALTRANMVSPKDRASRGADMLLLVTSSPPLVMAPRPINRVRV